MLNEQDRIFRSGGLDDAELVKAVRFTSRLRKGFYAVVLAVALGGQVTGAMERLHMPWYVALPALGALELGGMVVMANADVRRRLGERATVSRLLSAIIAAAATAFNWLAHHDHLLGGFFAGMSALGYAVWVMHVENQRRDRLRAKGDLPPTAPAYELVAHWLRHPWLTGRAKSLAKADPTLGLYGSLVAAEAQVRAERRQRAISTLLHRKIRASMDPVTADIAVAVYDLDEIAKRLAAGADYDGYTALIARDLAPHRIAGDDNPPVTAARAAPVRGELPTSELPASARELVELPAAERVDVRVEEPAAPVPQVPDRVNGSPTAPMAPARPRVPGDLANATSGGRGMGPGASMAAAEVPQSDERWQEETRPAGSLRERVHAVLDGEVGASDPRATKDLVALVSQRLGMDPLSKRDSDSISRNIRLWRSEVKGGQRPGAPVRLRMVPRQPNGAEGEDAAG